MKSLFVQTVCLYICIAHLYNYVHIYACIVHMQQAYACVCGGGGRWVMCVIFVCATFMLRITLKSCAGF